MDPAHAGMLPFSTMTHYARFSGPRACGDAPQRPAPGAHGQGWTPRMRGCSYTIKKYYIPAVVDPAHAGMLPAGLFWALSGACGPRACGDAPKKLTDELTTEQWTPRMRGCSFASWATIVSMLVDPAHAGMLLFGVDGFLNGFRGPRACGDAPTSIAYLPAYQGWTPRMRGCSYQSPGKETGH